ncbi:DUF625-domain-containing protein [Teratosphaeria nubilosa]|uniref:DUF625-domain-containing protein n=1 Tax=Teratosphaeria nubilosa TaxID=161662 RepID=A0A6G1L7Q0_9PEZI|nr:DUF625-domain-containing protein [Teratosphaeria nubilosa]
MAQAQTHQAQERKRVKVYELKNNDWYDRGTGFCQGSVVGSPTLTPENPDARILVVSEDDPNRTLLETRITKDDGYQKQQETLIVWTEHNGVDMALSFQEAEGCTSIWEFVSDIQQRLTQLAPDDGLSDDLLEPMHQLQLPPPELGRLDEIDQAIRSASQTPNGRDALQKCLLGDQEYILKLGPLVNQAEEQQDVGALHRLCTIIKHIILLNDNYIIEHVVTDAAIMGVVGALEYDPDFPSHKANHRQYLSDTSKFKEVVPIRHEAIRNKIHATYRLLYLKDVVLARILDDPTFSVLNSLIFFHQVDIVNHLQGDAEYLTALFDIFKEGEEQDGGRKKEAVLFLQNCCAVSKNIQAPSRAQLYSNFIGHGLFRVITFALRHQEASVRVAGTDILVALIDHDPHLVRSQIFSAIKEKNTPLTDTLIELLLVEVDLGVKSQMADAIKILLDPSTNSGMEMMARQANSELMAKRGNGPNGMSVSPQTEQFIQSFYEGGAKRLFQPLKDLVNQPNLGGLSVQESSLYTHLVEMLCFFVRAHAYRSKLFILGESLHARIAQLLNSPQKYMKLTAIKWFRTCVGLHDEFHNRQMIQYGLFAPILDIVYETMPKDNLLNSACLELFEFIKRDGANIPPLKQLVVHLVETYRERLMGITYVNTFQAIVNKYDQMQSGYAPPNGAEDSSFTTQEGRPQRVVNGRQPFSGLKEMDNDEEAYFNADDDIEDEADSLPTSVRHSGLPNGASPVKPLVNYPDDDEEEGMNILASSPDQDAQLARDRKDGSSSSDAMDTEPTSPETEEHRPSPPESITSKRRREEDDEDEIGKLMGGPKRRNSSSASQASIATGTRQITLDGSPSSPYQGNGPPTSSPSLLTQPVDLDHLQENQKPDSEAEKRPLLKRKGSLKTKNESVYSSDTYAIKPINIKAAQQPQQAENGHGVGGGEGDG